MSILALISSRHTIINKIDSILKAIPIFCDIPPFKRPVLGSDITAKIPEYLEILKNLNSEYENHIMVSNQVLSLIPLARITEELAKLDIIKHVINIDKFFHFEDELTHKFFLYCTFFMSVLAPEFLVRIFIKLETKSISKYSEIKVRVFHSDRAAYQPQRFYMYFPACFTSLFNAKQSPKFALTIDKQRFTYESEEIQFIHELLHFMHEITARRSDHYGDHQIPIDHAERPMSIDSRIRRGILASTYSKDPWGWSNFEELHTILGTKPGGLSENTLRDHFKISLRGSHQCYSFKIG